MQVKSKYFETVWYNFFKPFDIVWLQMMNLVCANVLFGKSLPYENSFSYEASFRTCKNVWIPVGRIINW